MSKAEEQSVFFLLDAWTSSVPKPGVFNHELAVCVMLFGSRAQGVHSEHSDYDFLCIGNGETQITEAVDVVWISEERLAAPAWRGSELAGHVARYGRCLHGDDSWRKDVFPSEAAVARKVEQIGDRVEILLPRWDRFLPVYHRKYLRLLRRDLQRLSLLSKSEPVPPTPTLDAAWDALGEKPDLPAWLHSQCEKQVLKSPVLDGIHRLEELARRK